MSFLVTLLDCVSAARTVARRRLQLYPYALYNVFLCKLRYGLGPKFHSLYNMGTAPREELSEYLCNKRMREVLRSVNSPAARELVDDKLLFHDHCVRRDLPTIPIVCAIQGGEGNYPKSLVVAETETEWCDRLRYASNRIFVKPIDGTWGRDAFVAYRKADEWCFAGLQGSPTMFYDFLKQRMKGKRGWLAQPLIEVHESLRSITSSQALATIRANTCLVDGVPRLLYAILRIPVGDNVTDNFSHGASGNIVAPIDLETGKLGPCRGSASRKWPHIVDVPLHPDTGNMVEGYQIPMWDQILKVLEEGQKSLPDLKTLGWDIAVTDQGPLIVEANATYDIDIVQVAYQRGVRSEMEKIFGAIG